MPRKNISLEKELESEIKKATGLEGIDPMGYEILIGAGGGVLKTSIISISPVANDDGYLEFGVAPVYFRGDLVTTIQFRSPDEAYLRYEFFKEGQRMTRLQACNAQILFPNYKK